jgi:DNA invertase Pin-like site-specific DNA recombinase
VAMADAKAARGRSRRGGGRGELVGYARCSTAAQDLSAQQEILLELGVANERVYRDHGLTGRNRARPALEKALAAVRGGDTLVVPKLDRLARSVPDARAIADELERRGVRLQVATTVYDPRDPMGKMFFNILAVFAEFEADLLSPRTREGMAVARGRCRLKGKPPKLAAMAAREHSIRFDGDTYQPGRQLPRPLAEQQRHGDDRARSSLREVQRRIRLRP